MEKMNIKTGPFAVIMLLAFPVFLHSQDYAGPDKRICPGKGTMIGGTGSGSFCYKWEPATGLSDTESPNPTANPMETTTYTVTVTSEDLSFSTSDVVTVTVDGIERLNITPKKCCWDKGETISESDFNIEKIPADIEGELTFMPTTAPFSSLEFAESTETIKAKFKCGDAMVEKDVMIKVIDKDFKASAANSQFSLAKVDFVKKVCKVSDDLKKKLSFPLLKGTCAPNISCTFDLPGTSFSYGKLCCAKSSECVKDNFRLNAVSGGISGGLQCFIPFYGVPAVASLNVALAANVGVNFSYNPIGADCNAENKQCITAAVALNISGGVAGCVGPCSGDLSLLRVQGIVIGTFTPSQNLEFCWPSGSSKPLSICGQADLEGSVTFVSLYSKKFKVGLIPKGCL